MTQLYAQPYDISANGFFFKSTEEYKEKASKLHNDYGQPVEEFEIQFIDGEDIDCELFKALSIHQGSLHHFFDAIEEWEDYQKVNVIIAVGDAGYDFDFDNNTPDDFDVFVYEMDSMKDLAEYFVDEGYFGEIPENLRFYIDYEAIARDLAIDYGDITIAGTHYIYNCA